MDVHYYPRVIVALLLRPNPERLGLQKKEFHGYVLLELYTDVLTDLSKRYDNYAEFLEGVIEIGTVEFSLLNEPQSYTKWLEVDIAVIDEMLRGHCDRLADMSRKAHADIWGYPDPDYRYLFGYGGHKDLWLFYDKSRKE